MQNLIYLPHGTHYIKRLVVFTRNLKERDHLGDPGVDGRIILRWTYRK